MSQELSARTRPYQPQTNDKAERFILPLLREWAYGIPCRHSLARTAMLSRWMHHYNPASAAPRN
jgi:transposase InsO family protein